MLFLPTVTLHLRNQYPSQDHSPRGQLRNGGFQTWHGHLAREKRAVSHEMPPAITGKMPVPRHFAIPSSPRQMAYSNLDIWGKL
jgi:hypothetical protein